MEKILLSPHLDRLIDLSLEEDIGPGDVTTQALIPPDLQGEAHIRAKAPLVAAGLPVAARVFRKLDAELIFAAAAADGQEVAKGTVLARLTGPVAAILTGERVALNFLQRLSGIATFTRAMAALVAGSPAVLVDTRKTTPGWRALEKYAGASGRRPQPPLRALRRGAHQEQSPDRGGLHRRSRAPGQSRGPQPAQD